MCSDYRCRGVFFRVFVLFFEGDSGLNLMISFVSGLFIQVLILFDVNQDRWSFTRAECVGGVNIGDDSSEVAVLQRSFV